MFENINLKEELIKERKTKHSLDAVIEEANSLLFDDQEQEKKIINQLSCNNEASINTGLIDSLDTQFIFDIQEIRTLAIKYRLRLLPSKCFRNSIPKEAIFKIKQLSKKSNTEIKKFVILAPSKAFDLKDENADPLLFIPLSASKYYLVHQWGNDLSWFNKLLSIPFRNFASIVTSVGVIAAIIALITPTWIILNSAEIDMGYWGYHRTAWFIYAYILLASMTTLICFSQSIYPSDYQWNKKTYN